MRGREQDVENDGAYAYVQMAPPRSPRHFNMQPRMYQQLGAQNQPQPYASCEEIQDAEEQAQEQRRVMYDVPQNRRFDGQPPVTLNIPTYDVPKSRDRSRPASPFEGMAENQQPGHPDQRQSLLLLPGHENRRGSRRYSGVNIENMDSEQIQLLISQLEAMGVLGHPKGPDQETEELYPEIDDTYDTISDEEERIYDDISNDSKPEYVNLDEVQRQHLEATQEALKQTTKKVKPVPPPRICRNISGGNEASAIPRTKSVGKLSTTAIYIYIYLDHTNTKMLLYDRMSFERDFKLQ